MAPSPLPPCEDTGNGPSTNTDSFSTLTWIFPASRTRRDKFPSFLSCPGSGLCENSLDGHRPGKLTQDLTARTPKELLSAVQPASSRRGHAFCSHSLTSCASTLPPAKGAGSYFQPLHTYPACTPPGHFPPSPGHSELSNIHFHSALTILYSEIAQSCMTLCDPMVCSLPGSSLHRILQARVLEWIAISFSRGSSRSRDPTQVSRIPGRRFNL